MARIYLDHNATTPLAPSVRAAMLDVLGARFGNPSSLHTEGRAARAVVEDARREVAKLVAAHADEVVFTSGGTESDQLAIVGAARARRRETGRDRVVSSPIEHPAVHGALAALAAEGFVITLARVDDRGTLDLEQLHKLVDDRTALVSIAVANHEIGVRAAVEQIAAITHGAGALLHCDAVQATGKLPLDVRALDVDLMSLSAHKIHGPKGAGALICRRGVTLDPLVTGGHQERERRAGTENVVGIAGLGAAVVFARSELLPSAERVARLRDRLEAGALALGARRFGGDARVANTSSLGFADVPGELLAMSLDLDGVAVATGAACSSGSLAPSPVLLALGCDRQTALTAVRFSLGHATSEAEIDDVLAMLPKKILQIRQAR